MMARTSKDDDSDAEMRALRPPRLLPEFGGDRTSQSGDESNDDGAGPIEQQPSTVAGTTSRPIGRPPRQLNTDSNDPVVRRRDEIALRQRERRLEKKREVQFLHQEVDKYKGQNRQLRGRIQQLEDQVRRMQEHQRAQESINTQMIMSLERDVNEKETARLNLESYYAQIFAQMEQTQIELRRQAEQGLAQLNDYQAQQGKDVGGGDDEGTAT